MRHQGWNVVAALAQSRQQYREDIQAIVEVATKFATIHHLRQIPICGCNEPNVHLVSPGTPQTLELLFLQYAQQFGLQRGRNITHFIQEKRAFVGQLETADLLRYGAGESALLVSKKLTFQQIQWYCSTIQPHKRPSAARADVVDRVCDELLAGACFSLNKNCRTGRRDPFDLFEHCFQSRTVTYYLLESALIRSWIARLQYPDCCHRGPLSPWVHVSCWAQLSRAARTLSSRASSSNGFA